MALTIIKIVILFCVLIIPLKGAPTRRPIRNKRAETTIVRSNYGIDEHGDLQELFHENKNNKNELL